VKALTPTAPGKALDDVRRHGVRRSPKLRTQFESFDSRKASCELVQSNEQVVGTLPSNKVFVALGHDLGTSNGRARQGNLPCPRHQPYLPHQPCLPCA